MAPKEILINTVYFHTNSPLFKYKKKNVLLPRHFHRGHEIHVDTH